MIVLDKSSSMQTGKIGTATKWSIAVDGLDEVLSNYENNAEFGLMTFPSPNACGPGAVKVAPGLQNRQAIISQLGTPPPTAGNYTPIAQSLDVAATQMSLTNAPAGKHVVLITDGWQWCSPYDPATRFDGVKAVDKLKAAGITTWIVGFGSEVDAEALNKMAVKAGTSKTGCNPANTDPMAPDQCYFQVDNAAELVAALTAISANTTAEECDGIDNNCDGQVDEDLTRDCSNACGGGTETCHAGTWSGCNTAPPAEVCDGVDNNCDGQVDESNPDLCDTGEVCLDGMCQPPNLVAGDPVGCGCQSGQLDAGSVAPFLVLGLILVGRRRRRA